MVEALSSVARRLCSSPPLGSVNAGGASPWPSTTVPVAASEPAPLKRRTLVVLTTSLKLPGPMLMVSPSAALPTAAPMVRHACAESRQVLASLPLLDTYHG